MDLFEVVDQVGEQLKRRGRITYRMLQAQFKLDEAELEALKAELIDGQRVAVDEDEIGRASCRERVYSSV